MVFRLSFSGDAVNEASPTRRSRGILAVCRPLLEVCIVCTEMRPRLARQLYEGHGVGGTIDLQYILIYAVTAAASSGWL
jgi:hypothetical protein